MGWLQHAAGLVEGLGWMGAAAGGFASVVALAMFMASRAARKDSAIQTPAQRRKLMAKHPVEVQQGLRHESSYFCTADGNLMYTQRFVPQHREPRCIICYCHGFQENTSWTAVHNAQRLANDLDAVVALIDYHGHGQSDGLFGVVHSFEGLVGDVCAYFDQVRAQYPDIPSFLFGNSMGGAAALRVAERQPGVFRGAMLVAPMTKIADEFKPPAFVVSIVMKLAHWFPYWAITPTPDVVDQSFRDKSRLAYVLQNPIQSKCKPRLCTARECLLTSYYLESHIHEVSIPFLVMHGDKDVVTSHKCSMEMYERAASQDKTLKIYEGSWHALTFGEPMEVTDRVFRDMTAWARARIEM